MVSSIGADTLSDSARIIRLAPEPDGQSVAFTFADPAKGITRGLGIGQASSSQASQLAWPDSVTAFWWSAPHELSFIAGTGQGVLVVVDVHAAQLEALRMAKGRQRPQPSGGPDAARGDAESRARMYIDSLRVQPEGNPQRSALRYQPDTVILAAGDTLAAVHVTASANGGQVNPAWYLLHIPSRRIQPIDSLVGQSAGLPPTAGQWDARGVFYYAKERSIWRAVPKVQ
ncbi:MAG: hypothetical protein ACT4PJ_02650 [Gemmatimonadaceae bacterium]